MLFLGRRFFASQKGFVLTAWLNLFLRGAFLAILLKLVLYPDSLFAPLFGAGILAAFLLDSIILRLGIFAVGMDSSSLFFKRTPVDSAWRPDRKFLRLKRNIEGRGMRKVGSYIGSWESELRPKCYLTTFLSEDSKTVLEVSFADLGSGLITCSAAASQSEDGTFILTSGRFESDLFPAVPDCVEAEFHPLNSNPLKTLSRHRRRISRMKNLSPLDDGALESINRAFEQKCEDDGLINEQEDRSECGLFTPRGAYLAWKSILRLRYFGM